MMAAALAALLVTVAPMQTPQYVERSLTFTHYLPTGNRTYSGEWPSTGAAACSWDLPLGTVIVLDQGHVYRCADRGHLGSRGWLDAYVETPDEGRELARTYGQRVQARVFLPLPERRQTGPLSPGGRFTAGLNPGIPGTEALHAVTRLSGGWCKTMPSTGERSALAVGFRRTRQIRGWHPRPAHHFGGGGDQCVPRAGRALDLQVCVGVPGQSDSAPRHMGQ